MITVNITCMNKCQSQFRVRNASYYNLPPGTLTQKTNIVPRQRYPRGDRSTMEPAQRYSSRWRSSVDFRRNAGFRLVPCGSDLRSIRWSSGQCSFSIRADFRVPTKCLSSLYCSLAVDRIVDARQMLKGPPM